MISGLLTLVVLLGVCLVIIIGLIVFISARLLHEEKQRRELLASAPNKE